MIAHLSPASYNFEESRNTLSYADRAKSIKLKAKKNSYNVNYHVAQYQSIISDLRQEIIRLKTQLVEVDADNRGIGEFPVDTGRKLNVHKTFRKRPERLLTVSCTFNLNPVTVGLHI